MPSSTSNNMDDCTIDKTISVLCYFTLIGWLIALVLYGKYKSPLARFHLRQSLGLFITGALLTFIPLIGWFANIFILMAWCYGVYSAFIYHKLNVPIVGDYYQEHFDFIK